MRERLLLRERVRRRQISLLSGVDRIGRFRFLADESTVDGRVFILGGQESFRTKLVDHRTVVRCAYTSDELLDLIFSQVDGQYATGPTSQSSASLSLSCVTHVAITTMERHAMRMIITFFETTDGKNGC